MPDDPLAQLAIFVIAIAGITAGSIYFAERVTRRRPRKPKETP